MPEFTSELHTSNLLSRFGDPSDAMFSIPTHLALESQFDNLVNTGLDASQMEPDAL